MNWIEQAELTVVSEHQLKVIARLRILMIYRLKQLLDALSFGIAVIAAQIF